MLPRNLRERDSHHPLRHIKTHEFDCAHGRRLCEKSKRKNSFRIFLKERNESSTLLVGSRYSV